MTDSTLDTLYLVLDDKWPKGKSIHAIPQDGFNGSSHHNVVTEEYPVGTKYTGYDHNVLSKGTKGPYTMMYGRMGTANGTTAVAAKSVMVPGSATNPFHLSNCYDTAGLVSTGSPLVAIALGAMTTQYYGWFWVGGICPANLITSGTSYVLDGNIKTDGGVTIGSIMAQGNSSGEIKLATLVAATSLALNVACGYSGAADA